MSSRPPPPQGAPPSYAFVTRVYQRNLRPVVMVFAFLAALWSLFTTIGAFRNVSVDRQEHQSKLATFSIVTGALFAAITVIESFGVFASATQRLPLIRLYAIGSCLSALIVIAAELLQVIVHFTHKGEILAECTDLLTSAGTVVYPYGLFGPRYHDFSNPADASSWCNDAWNHDSWADIVELLILAVLALLFSSVALAYYRQALDPSSPANFSRTPRTAVGDYPLHYNPPYNPSVPNLGYGYNLPYAGGPPPRQYAPPPGPPPNGRFDADGKPPGYVGGDGNAGAGYGVEKGDNPFSDFDGPSDGERNGANGRAREA